MIWVNWVLRWIVKEFRSIFSVVIFILNFRIYSIDYVRVCIPCSTVHRHNRIIPCVICFYSILLLNRDASIGLAGTLAFVCAYFIADFWQVPITKCIQLEFQYTIHERVFDRPYWRVLFLFIFLQTFPPTTFSNCSARHFSNSVKTPATIRSFKCLVLRHVIFYK